MERREGSSVKGWDRQQCVAGQSGQEPRDTQDQEVATGGVQVLCLSCPRVLCQSCDAILKIGRLPF